MASATVTIKIHTHSYLNIFPWGLTLAKDLFKELGVGRGLPLYLRALMNNGDYTVPSPLDYEDEMRHCMKCSPVPGTERTIMLPW